MGRRITHAGPAEPVEPAEECQHVDARPVLIPGPAGWPIGARLCMTCGVVIPETETAVSVETD